MKIFFLLLALMFGMTFPATFASAQESITPNFPHIRTWGVLYRYNNVDDIEAQWWATHLDFTVFGPIYWGAKFRTFSAAPAVTYMNHHNITVESASSSDWQNLANYAGANFEDMFLHYAEDTTIKLNGATCTIKGWGSGTATSREQARVPTYWLPSSSCGGSQRDRWSLNIANPMLRAWVAQRASMLAVPPYTGIFFDNASGDWITSSKQGIVSGGRIIEYPFTDKISLDTAWNADHEQVLSEAKAALGNRLSIINTGNYQSNYAWVNDVLPFADGSLREFWFNINSAWGTSAPTMLDDITKSDALGKINLIWAQDNYGSCCNGQLTKERSQIWALSAYYLLHGRHTYFKWSNDTGAVKTNDRSWFPAIEYNIGQPLGSYYLWPVTKTDHSTGLDPNGYPVTIYARQFTNALILNRPKAKWNYNDFSDTSMITVYLPGNFSLLNADGSLGKTTNSITIRNGEGAILIVSTQSMTVSATTQAASEVILIPTIPLIPTPDTTSPTTPTNLTATSPSTSQINLAWTASTDNVGVASYRIYRNGTQIGTATTNSYSNTGLSPSTSYTYTVAAYDAAGNTSSQSTSASGSTQNAPVITPPTTTPTLPPSTIPTTPSASGATGSISIHTPPTTPTVSTPPPPPSTPTSRLSLTRNLYRGTKGTDVKSLQTFLIQQGHLAPTSDTGFYGPLTKQAVEKYQCARSLVCSGAEVTTGYGVVGPKTRAKLNGSGTTTTTPYVSTSKLTPAQADAIIALIQSFGADAAVIARVKVVLGR